MRGSDILSKAKNPAAPPASPRPRSPERFHLAGPTVSIDRRVNAIRSDIADVALAGRFFAPHYAAAQPVRCVVPSVPLRHAPSSDAHAVSELRLGDDFALLDRTGGWAWGYGEDDRYVGYVPVEALAADTRAPTHGVEARAALVFAAPDIKAPVVESWPMGARFAATGDGTFLATDRGFVHHRHAGPLDRIETQPAAVAERLLGTPYRWGGRSGCGIDCSGLVQLALARCGIAAPRDSDQQRAELGRALGDDEPPQRGDLVFFPGHVGIMADADRLIHANAYWMVATVEPLADIVARLAPDHAAPVLARRRLA